jgi:hypothetical protein
MPAKVVVLARFVMMHCEVFVACRPELRGASVLERRSPFLSLGLGLFDDNRVHFQTNFFWLVTEKKSGRFG